MTALADVFAKEAATQAAHADGWSVFVIGTPAPKGSRRHVGRGITVESSKAVGPWMDSIVEACRQAGVLGLGLDGNILLTVTFAFARPKGHYGTGRNAGVLRPSAPTAPNTRVDLDKLIRAVGDALVRARVIVDDSRIVWIVAMKAYLDSPTDVPGARIGLRVIP